MIPMSAVSPQASRAARVFVEDFLALHEGESVLLTADTANDPATIELIMNAAAAAGARPSVMIVPQLPFQGGLADPYVPEPLAAATRGCDVWVDLTFPYLAGSHVHDEAIKAGRVRYVLLTGLSADGLTRIYGQADQDLLYAVQSTFDALAGAAVGRRCRITTPDGTDVSFVMAEPGYVKRRRLDQPGMLTPPGSAAFFPELDSVRGQVVVWSAFHEYYSEMASPLTIEIDGRVRAVEGGGNDGYAMDRALRRAGNGEYGYVIHFTHGFHPATRPGVCLLEDIRGRGNNAIGLGLPWWEPGGGETHPDGIARRQSIWLDGDQVVRDGDFVSPPELVELACGLQPVLA